MQKHLILLLGPTQSGKTSSIKIVLHQLHMMEPELEFRGKNWIECMEVLSTNGRRVGITSRSDKYATLKQNLDLLMNEHQCEVIICAANEMMKGVKELLIEFQANGWKLSKVQKFPLYFSRENKDNQGSLNQKAAEKIIEKFNQIF
jgi:ABC-type multidrug transport system ATPase subunit